MRMNDDLNRDMEKGKETIKEGWTDAKRGAENLGEDVKQDARTVESEIRDDL